MRKYLCAPLQLPIYAFGFAFMLSVFLYAIALRGWKVGCKRFDKLLDLLIDSVE